MSKDNPVEIEAMLTEAVQRFYPGRKALFDPKHKMYVSMKVVDLQTAEICFTSPDYVRYPNVWDKRNDLKRMLAIWKGQYEQSKGGESLATIGDS
jgi:hypothetical protein